MSKYQSMKGFTLVEIVNSKWTTLIFSIISAHFELCSQCHLSIIGVALFVFWHTWIVRYQRLSERIKSWG